MAAPFWSHRPVPELRLTPGRPGLESVEITRASVNGGGGEEERFHEQSKRENDGGAWLGG